MIKAVLFDYGGVLSSGGQTVKYTFSELLGVPPEKLGHDELGLLLRTGKISADDFFAELSKRYNKQVTVEEFIALSDIFAKSNPVYQLAAKLRKNGIKTGILSNMYQFGADILERDGFYADFDPLLISSQEGLAKPDPAFYQLGLDKLGLKGEEVLFIDDREEMLPPAKDLGMHVIQALSAKQIVADTKRLFKTENNLAL